MDLKTFKQNKDLTYDELGRLFGMSRSRVFDLCTGRKGCIRIQEMNTIIQVADGEISPEDLGLVGDC